MTSNNQRRGSEKVKFAVIDKGEERKGKGEGDRGNIAESDLFYEQSKAEAQAVANKRGYLRRR